LYPDPDKLNQVTPAEVLDAASRGHLGLDHRFLRALLDRPEESLPAVRAFAARDRSEDAVDLAPELIALFRHWNTPDAVPFLVAYVREDPQDVPDEVVEALAAIGRPALDPLLALSEELDESEAGEIAFLLVSLHIRDDRILQLLKDRLEYDLSDTLLLLGIYGDPSAIPAIEEAAAQLEPHETELKKEVADTVEALKSPSVETGGGGEEFDIWSLYPEREDLPLDLLDEDKRTALLSHPVASIRAAAVHSFFNQDLTPDQTKKILQCALRDSSADVRARAWEALINATEQIEVVEAMLSTLRRPELPIEERSGLVVGLAPEADRNEVRQAIADLYNQPEGRAKALEAMWRSMHPTFRDYFARHLEDVDQEVQRGAIWGVGYYGLRSELERLRQFFSNEELRSDALFAYALVVPSDTSRGRMKGLLTRIEKDARGLSEMEEELVKAALDERLMLVGKEPVFRDQED
jgi:hypothetical protein